MQPKKLRILFVAPYLPAVRLRPHNFITQLVKMGHSITVACLVQPKSDYKYVKEFQPLGVESFLVYPNRLNSVKNAFVSLASSIPLSIAFSSSVELHKVINELIIGSKFDLIHTEFIRACQYTVDLKNIPKLFDAVDCLTLAYHRALKNKNTMFAHRVLALEEWAKMKNYEPTMSRLFDRTIVSSPADQSYLVDHGTMAEVVPNGVDFDYFYWNPQREETDSLVFLGKMSYYVNIDSVYYFYRKIYPLIKAERPDIRLTIVGANPTSSVCALTKDPTIKVTGFVPDVRPYLSKAAISIAPMISGSGIQNKILEAMAVGTPVVTTSLACQALRVKNGVHLIIADDSKDFAQAVLNLLKDKPLQRELSANARHYVEEFHNWQKIGQQLEDIYMTIL